MNKQYISLHVNIADELMLDVVYPTAMIVTLDFELACYLLRLLNIVLGIEKEKLPIDKATLFGDNIKDHLVFIDEFEEYGLITNVPQDTFILPDHLRIIVRSDGIFFETTFYGVLVETIDPVLRDDLLMCAGYV